MKFARRRLLPPLVVNAVLRRCADEAKVPAETLLAAAKAEASRATWLAVLHSHPTWLVERWLAQYGEPQTIAILERTIDLRASLATPPRPTSATNSLQNLNVRPPGLPRHFSARRVLCQRRQHRPLRSVSRRPTLAIQDEASQAIPLLLSVEPGQKVLDLCCAPGGKTAILARASAPHGSVVASDFHSHRLRATRDQIIRVAAKNVHVVQLDAAKPLPFAQKFDRILVDAPCSGTGTSARHPEIRWRLSPDQLASFKPLQSALLAMALENLTPGGRLLYSTCSIEREENEAIVSAALAARNQNPPHRRS